jgi:hypothetical protein
VRRTEEGSCITHTHHKLFVYDISNVLRNEATKYGLTMAGKEETAVPGAVAAATAANPGFKFALSPGTAFDGVLDYRNEVEASIFFEAIKSLYVDPKECFDCEPENLLKFLDKVESRGKSFGWVKDTGILWVPKESKGRLKFSDKKVSLLENYGSIPHQVIFKWEKSFIEEHTREAQDSYMLADCLLASLSRQGQRKIQARKKDYYHNQHICGVSLLNVIIRESTIDSGATTLSIRRDLSCIEDYIVSVNFDISQVDLYVRTKLDVLRALGEPVSSTDGLLLVSVIDAYKCAPDKEFRDYVAQLEQGHEDGTKPLTLPQFMQFTANKYKNLVQSNQWNAPSAQDEQVLDLLTTVAKLSQKTKKRKEPP